MALSCSKHGADVAYSCETCSEYVCSKCLASGHHRGHYFTRLQDLFAYETKKMSGVQEQTKETMRVIEALIKEIDGEDSRLEKSCQQTLEQVDHFFQSVFDMTNDRERALVERVESNQSNFVSKLDWYHSQLEAAERGCQHWLKRQHQVVEQLRGNEVTAIGEYNECMEGLEQEEQKIAELNSSLVRILQLPPVISFKSKPQQSKQLKEAIDSLGEFDRYTATTIQEPEKVAYYQITEARHKNVFNPGYSELTTTLQRKLVAEGHLPSVLPAQVQPLPHQYRAISTSSMTPAREYDQPESVSSLSNTGTVVHGKPSAVYSRSAVYQPETIVSYSDINDNAAKDDDYSAWPTRVCISSDFVVVTESSAISCFQDGKLLKQITKVGRMKLAQAKGITYYAKKKKFLIVDASLKKLIKVKPESGKADAVDLPQINCPSEITIDLGPTPTVFVTDSQSKNILKYNTDGKYKATVNLQGISGIKRPAGIAYANGYIFIADIDSHCIFKLDPEGVLVEAIGSPGNLPGYLNQPYGIAVLPNGLFAVTEMGNHRVSVFNTEGQFETCFGNKGREPGMFITPKGISANSTHLAVVDYGNQRHQVFAIQTLVNMDSADEIYEKI